MYTLTLDLALIMRNQRGNMSIACLTLLISYDTYHTVIIYLPVITVRKTRHFANQYIYGVDFSDSLE